MKRILIASLVTAAFATAAFAQSSIAHKADPAEPGSVLFDLQKGPAAVQAPAVVAAPAAPIVVAPVVPVLPAVVVDADKVVCTRVVLAFPNIKEEGKGWITIQTDPSKIPGDGMLEALQSCNGANSAKSQAASKNSVDVLSVFTAQGETTVKVPAKWKTVLRARFHSPDPRFGDQNFWQSTAFGDSNEISMVVTKQGDGKIAETRKF